jgi:hypothetical protein
MCLITVVESVALFCFPLPSMKRHGKAVRIKILLPVNSLIGFSSRFIVTFDSMFVTDD